MDKNKQRIAIAEACINSGMDVFFDGGGIPRWKQNAVGFDPLNDLNAMHEAWKHVIAPDGYLRRMWSKHLIRISRVSYSNATAAQRAEAFLKTIGKWEK